MRQRPLRKQRRRFLPETIAAAALPHVTARSELINDVAPIDRSLHRIPKFAADFGEGDVRPFQHQTDGTRQVRGTGSVTAERHRHIGRYTRASDAPSRHVGSHSA